MRVLVLNDSGQPTTRLKEWLLRYHFDIIAEPDSYHQLAQDVSKTLPDAIIVDTPSPSQKMLDQFDLINSKLPRPILVFSKDGRGDTIKAAIHRGVTCYLVGNFNPERLPAVMRVAIARFDEEMIRRKEMERLKLELAQLKAVTRAKIIIMKTRNCTEDEAHRVLRQIAMSRSMKLGEIAEQLVQLSTLLGGAAIMESK